MTTVDSLTDTTIETPPDWQDTELPDLAALEALDLPDSDGEPMENQRERIQINLVIELL